MAVTAAESSKLDEAMAANMDAPMKVLDIAPHRDRRQEFSFAITNSGHEVITVPGRVR